MIPCNNTTSICSEGTYCLHEPKVDNDYCMFGTYLCIDDNQYSCILIDQSKFDLYKEEVKEKYKNTPEEESKPILKTCNKENVDNKTCKTQKCEIDHDCISGSCYSNSCITTKDIYICQELVTNNLLHTYCKKQSQMKCETDEECFSGNCISNYCINEIEKNELSKQEKINSDDNNNSSSTKNKIQMIIYIAIIVIIVIIIIYLIYRYLPTYY
ncbi:hypothetical protein BCR32DRAFT_329338 [Anaeromyces robustus]|uniref:Dickkopf N-terminal cysteine-rich domain-containing protein n=1 Tax=Anaeromyces robustus TaxID=1754192 RepID=A0A1Y1WSG2_9FUNG|nr:hypothetical protein BCR32DRAFT_329338 [Anaeromyces robustus]|eukprot:ORX76481.1 hypothetical protein BCR32DRAFT_329338 [Anaeromyces robustus]